MKKLKILSAVGLSLAMLAGAAGCGESGKYSDYYTFDTGSIASELLYGSEMKIDPVVRNLGTVVDANYSVSVTLDGTDVTSAVYDAESKIFAPERDADAIGVYTFNLTIVDDNGKAVLDENGKTFSTSFDVDYCIMNFVAKANAGTGVSVNNDDPLTPVISFDSTYSSGSFVDSGQYRLTGVSFSGDYEIIYKIKLEAAGDQEETRFFFGVDRTDENKRDDNIALNADGRLSSWFFQDSGQPGGDDWTGTGWVNTAKTVSNNLFDGREHLIGFTRIIGNSGNAYYVVTWDGDYFTTLNVKGNYTDVLDGVWVESINIEGSIAVESYRELADDTTGPAVLLNYDDCGVGTEVTLSDGIVIQDEIYNATQSIVWTVTDPSGEAVSVSNGAVTLSSGGVYTVSAVVTDLKGNVSRTATTQINVYSDFTVTNFGLENFYRADEEITVGFAFTSDDQAMRDDMTVKVLREGIDTQTEITGDADGGFSFTVAEAGVYTLYASTYTAGRNVVKTVEFTVSGADAADIDLTENTAEARTNVSHILYATPSDGVTLSILKGDTLESAADVTSEVVKTHTTSTLEENVTYYYFTPTAAGVYYLTAEQGSGDTYTLRAAKINVKDDVIWVYDDEKLDVGNGNLDKVIYGNNTVIFLDNGSTAYETSKLVYDNLGYTGDFTIEFKVTDLKFHAGNKKLFFTMGMYNAGGEWDWNDICIEGGVNDDLWGYCTNIFGFGWVEYQWRSIWQSPVTDEFVPDDDADGTSYAFRGGSEYTQYATGTHTYRIEVRMTEANTYTVYFYIDGRPEATHRNLTYAYNTLGCIVINSDTMSGVVSDITIVNE